MIPTSLELLQRQLSDLEYSLTKSKTMYDRGSISLDLHHIHKMNLEPKIKEYQSAINKLLDL